MDTDNQDFHQEQNELTPENKSHEKKQESKNINEKDDQTLSMTVWLKGHEEYFADFSWDAKKVMEILGIKRSRLNQISGDELRVGKARIDRYLRPIYRPEDVKKYLEWTKPTASHKRSTNIVDEARLKLDKTSQELKSNILSSQAEFKDELSKIFDSIIAQVTYNNRELQASLFKHIKNLFRKFSLYQQHESSRLRDDTKELEKILRELKKRQNFLIEKSVLLENNQNEVLKNLNTLSLEIKQFKNQNTQTKNENKEININVKTILNSLEEKKSVEKIKNLSVTETKKINRIKISKRETKKIKSVKPLSNCERKKVNWKKP